MALDFPASPTVGQLFPSPPTAGLPVWKWDGTTWNVYTNQGSAAFSQYEFTATAGQTTFTGADISGNTLAYALGYVMVFVNGDRLNKADYTASNGTSIVFAVGRAVGDQVTVEALTVASIINALLTTNNLSDLTNVATARTNLGVGQGQILGEPSNGSASAGNVGEYLSSTVLVGSAVAITSSVAKDITSITLTPGDWDVWGTGVTIPAGGTTQNQFIVWTSTTSATVPPLTSGGCQFLQAAFTAGGSIALGAMPTRYSVSVNTTIFLSCLATFGVSTNAAYGIIQARRRR